MTDNIHNDAEYEKIEQEKLLKEQDIADRFEKIIVRYEAEFGDEATPEQSMEMAQQMKEVISELPNEPVRTPYFKELFDNAQRVLLERDLEAS
tara:strand:+ start:148 stop:426 length:279 start_codon:yes stop_codon:yes gene_type:complete